MAKKLTEKEKQKVIIDKKDYPKETQTKKKGK